LEAAAVQAFRLLANRFRLAEVLALLRDTATGLADKARVPDQLLELV
jgi:hypothetical protein